MKNKNTVILFCKAAFGLLLVLTVLLASCLTEVDEKVIVKFDSNGGSTAPADRELIKGSKLGSVSTPTKDTYQFLGWFSSFDLYDANTAVYGDITLVAKWKSLTAANTVNVTFNAPGAVPPQTIVEVAVGNALGPLFPMNPRKEGYKFEGWEAEDVEFSKTSVVTEPITVTPTWSEKNMFTVTLSVPAIHQAANPGIDSKRFYVYEGDSIDEWEKQFPSEMNTAPDPNEDQYHQFFRWSEGGLANGVIYTERTPIEKSVTLGAIYGLYFHKKTYEIDLTTVLSKVSMNDYRTGSFTAKYPMTGAANEIANPVRLPLPENVVTNANGSVSFTVQAQPTLMYFRPTVELWQIMKQALVENDTKVSFWLDYEFQNPAQEDDDNKLNIFFGNLMNNDNWNSTEVRDLTWKDIVFGEESNGERNGPELHKLAATIINFDQNVDWIIFRMGRIDTKVPFRMTIKGFKVTVEQ